MVNIFSLFSKKPNILVIVGGNKTKIEKFLEAGLALNINVTTASFSELWYSSEGEFALKLGETDIKSFTHIYIRMVGKRLEDVTLISNYAKKHGIKLIDPLYSNSLLMPSSLGKSIEMMKILENNVAMPKTLFGSIEYLSKEAANVVGFPCVIKSTTGKKAREVWCPETKKDFKLLMERLLIKEKEGMRFFAQEFVPATERIRVFVIGKKAIAAIVRPSRWRKRFGNEEGRKIALNPIPESDAKLAIAAAAACGLSVSGVDIVHNHKTDESYVLEANAAPVWKLLAKDSHINIEEEILKYIVSI